MKTIEVSESALDSIKRMGEADAARIAKLEAALREARALAASEHIIVRGEIVALIDEALK